MLLRLLALIGILMPSLASAHAGDLGFVLLLPTGLYSAAGVMVVALSILMVSFVPDRQVTRLFTPRRIGHLPELRRLRRLSGLGATAGFFGLIAVGLLGPANPVANLLPLAVWTVFWVGLMVAQGVFGDVWYWINPWRALYDLLNPRGDALLPLPRRVGIWPAVVLIIMVNGFVVADIAPSDPRRLAGYALGYWLFTFAGMMLFGGKAWLARVECFTVFFRFLASLAPLHGDTSLAPPRGDTNPAPLRGDTNLRIGVPGWQSLHAIQMTPSRAIFCLALLACGSFDGLNETFWWLGKIGINPLEYPGRSAAIWSSTAGLIVANIALPVVFGLSVWGGLALANRIRQGAGVAFMTAFCAFSIALLPIAFGYHIAHYMTSFLVQIQYVALALNDPMANGANLLGLQNMHVTTGFLNTKASVRVIWLSQAGAVVLSHVLSVLMAHHVAHKLFANRHEATLAQIGIGVLMIAYTIFGLWLLASPRGL